MVKKIYLLVLFIGASIGSLEAQYTWYENASSTNNIRYTSATNGVFTVNETNPETTGINENTTVSKFVRDGGYNPTIHFNLANPITDLSSYTISLKAYTSTQTTDLSTTNKKIRLYLTNTSIGSTTYVQLQFTEGETWESFSYNFDGATIPSNVLLAGGYDQIYIKLAVGDNTELTTTYYIDSISGSTQQPPIVPYAEFLSDSWGVRFNISGGIKLDNTADYNWVAGAQQIVDSLPAVGHVITNFTHPAHGMYYTLRDNPRVNVADIHPSMVPTLENEQIILDVIDSLKNGGKKVILYVNGGGPSHLQNEDDEEQIAILAAWTVYCDANFGGDQGAGWRELARGYFERFEALGVDGYWIDNLSNLPGELDEFIAMIREVDPDAALATNLDKAYLEYESGKKEKVASDGLDDEDPTDYNIFLLEATDPYMDFTAGHPTPLGQGAPPNSWAYEEFNFPLITENPWASYDGSRQTLKHYFIPIRERWSVASVDLVFEAEQAYRFVRTFSDAGATMTWSTTITNGYISGDEMAIMQEVNDRMEQSPRPDYISYQRPEGACLVNELETIHSPDTCGALLTENQSINATYEASVPNPNETGNTSTNVSRINNTTPGGRVEFTLPYNIAVGTVITLRSKYFSEYAGANNSGTGRVRLRMYNSTLGYSNSFINIANYDKIGGEWQTETTTIKLSGNDDAAITANGGYDSIAILGSNNADSLELLYFDAIQIYMDSNVANKTAELEENNVWLYNYSPDEFNAGITTFGGATASNETTPLIYSNSSPTVLKVTRAADSNGGVVFNTGDFDYTSSTLKFRIYPVCTANVLDPTIKIILRKVGTQNDDVQKEYASILISNRWNEITLDLSDADGTGGASTAPNNLYDQIHFVLNEGVEAASDGAIFYIDAVQNSRSTLHWDADTDADWNNATNWGNNILPNNSYNVSISPSIVSAANTITTFPEIGAATNVSINDLQITGLLTVAEGSSLTINGTATINSGASLIANGAITGSFTYQRTLNYQDGNAEGWHLVASPIVGQDYDDTYISNNDIAIGSGNNSAIATYNNNVSSGNWAYQQTGTIGTFQSGIGYSIKRGTTAGNISFTGTLNTEEVSTPITVGSGSAFNLIGNPYTAHINSASFLTTNTALLTSQTIWVWDQVQKNYITKVTGSAFKIAPGQGFFVEASTAGSVIYAKENQSHETDTFLRTATNPQIVLNITDGTLSRSAEIYYLENATKGFDNGYDGETFGGTENNFDIFTQLLENNEGKNYQLQALPNKDLETMVIPIGLLAEAGKEITFTADAMNLITNSKVLLEDRLNNTFIRLDEANASYKITPAEALNGIGRFYLHTTKNISEASSLTNIQVYKIDKTTLRIAGLSKGKATLKLFTVLGKQVITVSIEGNGVNDISLPKLAPGVYVIQIQTATGQLNKKIAFE